MKLIVLLLCTWCVAAEPRNSEADPTSKQEPEEHQGQELSVFGRKPIPIPVYGSAKTVFKQLSSGKIQVGQPSLARQGRGRFGMHGYGWARREGVNLPAWASKAILLLPYGGRRPVLNRPGTVKSGSKLYHVVKLSQVQSSEKLEELALHLIQVLFEKKAISALVGAKIINTFALKPFGEFANQPKALLQLDTVKSLTVKGLVKARNRFVRGLRILINRRDTPNKVKTLVKHLYQLVLDNEYNRVPVAIDTAAKFGVRLQVTARSQGIHLIHKPGLARFINVVQTIRGNPAQLTSLANHLATVLVKRRIITTDFVRQFFKTFSVAAHGHLEGDAEPLTDEDLKILHSVRGRPLTRRRFAHDLRAFVAQVHNKSAEQRLEQVVRLLVRLIIGNGIRRAKQFEQVTQKKFGVTIAIQRQFPNYTEQPWLKPKKLKTVPVQSLVYFNKVFHGSPIPKDKTSTYIRKLLHLLVEGNVFDLNIARTLLATFHIKAPGKFSPTADVEPWTPETLNTFRVGGNPFSRGNFLNVILQLLLAKDKPEVDKVVEILSRSLLELSLDNEIIDIKNATQLAQSTGIKLICRKLPAPPVKPDELGSEEPEEKEEVDEEEDEDGNKSLGGGVIIGGENDGAIAEPEENHIADHEEAEEGHEEEEEDDSGEDDSDSDEDESGDSSESDENEGTPEQEDDDDDDDDDNIKPEKVIDSLVAFDKTAPEKRLAFILHLFTVLADHELLQREAIGRILATFGLDGGDKFPHQQPVAADSIDELKVDGTDEAKEKFATTLAQLIKSIPDQSEHLDTLLKVLLEFAIDNQAILHKDAESLAKTFDYAITVEVKKIHVELEHNLNLGQPAAFGVEYLSQVEIEDNEQDNLPFADNTLVTLVDNSLIDPTTALNLLTTFGYNGTSRFGDIKTGKKLDKNSISALQVVSDPDAKKKFLERLEKNATSAKPRQASLIGLAFELALDNAVQDIHAAGKLAVQFGYSISIGVIKIVSQLQAVLATVPAGTKLFSSVQITGSYAEDLSPFLNQLAGELASAKVLNVELSNKIFATFGVIKATGNAISDEQISALDVKGDPDAKSKFLTGLSALSSSKNAKSDSAKAEPGYDLTGLLKLYLELLLDNGGIQAQDAAQLAVSHGVSVSIQETTVSSQATKV